ncbi:hypothetical protein [Litorimonas haliclonae]|jgi:hypothetical protein|uniref:hypothetical protein n=1 Tax=Litorimonas TaxID=1167830 RepID=UPI0039EFED04
MKYLGYLLIILTAVAGFLKWPWILIFVFAAVSTFAFAKVRRDALKNTPMAPDQNMILDGAFLFFGQTLIMLVAYLLGVFAAAPTGELFMKFISGQG